MKKWPTRVIVFYILAVLCQAPAFCWVFYAMRPKTVDTFGATLGLLPSMLIVVCGALMLLTVRVDKMTHYPMAQRHIVIPIAVGLLLFLLLALSICMSTATGIWGDHWGTAARAECLLLAVVFVWCVWGLLFYRYFRARGYEQGIRRMFNVLLAGSVLELLIAVTSHMILRQRSTCSAPFINFWGLLMGLSIMFISFGPGIIFLYRDKLARGKKTPAAYPAATVARTERME